MERHAHYALVGVISTLLVIAAFIFVVWLGRFEFDRQFDEYRIVFSGPVRGLSVGGDVQFSGIKVGTIQHITLDAQDPNKVITDIRIDGETPVRVDSEATTELQGISGIDVIQISAGTPSKPLLRQVDTSKRPTIRSKPNALASLLLGGGQMLETATESLTRVNRLLSDGNIANLTGAVRDIRSTTAAFAANRSMFSDAAATLAKLDSAATDIQGAAASVHKIADGDGRQAFSDISSAAGELKLAVHEARGTIARLDGQTGALASTTIPDIDATMRSLQDTADSLNGLVRSIREDPRGTLTKPRGKELELPK
ncbi:ABC transporter substrate-binding protein [Sphingomonas glacialis]|uniref:ABC transporter substrate-binding protein n=1 Tax=Sphingomonas glacialis TaxID=658225 RepID=A0ABQ3LS23_9SPHN|nr:MlaD family protein [Sphingomonas glacialis]GHH24641.1 ABC transporter substrate-binding protein [Sphingomonas glacialis]